MSLNDFSTAPLNDGVDFANLPEQMGSFAPPPPPGPYRFALSPLSAANFDKVQSPDYGERAKVKFDQSAPLVIKQSLAGAHDNEPFQTTITNTPRKRGKGDTAPVASDWDYLNQALKIPVRPTTNRAYCETLLAESQKRAEFGADLEWSWSCNPNRDAYFDDGQGGQATALNAATGANIQGCGARYYQGAVAKVDGAYPLRLQCATCGASVRAFANLTRFRP